MRISAKWNAERDRLLECVANAQAEVEAVKSKAAEAATNDAGSLSSLKSKIMEAEQRLDDVRRAAQADKERAVKERLGAEAELKRLSTAVENLQREIGIKDKQLAHLRQQLQDATTNGGATSFLGMAAAAGAMRLGASGCVSNPTTSPNDELMDILEEEKKEMQQAYEQKIEELTLELDQARRQLREARK